jgi:hypothetical protein
MEKTLHKLVTGALVVIVLLLALNLHQMNRKIAAVEARLDSVQTTSWQGGAVPFINLYEYDVSGSPTGQLDIGLWFDDDNSVTLQLFAGELQFSVLEDGVWYHPLQVTKAGVR